MDEAKLLVVNYKLGVLCFAANDTPLVYVVSKLIIPGLVDQLRTMKNMILPNLLQKHPKVDFISFCVVITKISRYFLEKSKT